MSDLQRYDLHVDAVGGEMRKDGYGDWIEFEDHERIVKQIHKDYGCEIADPNGTIWDHSANLASKNEQLEIIVKDLVDALKKIHWMSERRASPEWGNACQIAAVAIANVKEATE